MKSQEEESASLSSRSEAPPLPYRGRNPSSRQATAAAKAASRKTDTRCEVLLRRVLWLAGYRFRKNVADLPGQPDIVFSRAKVAIFCDGDFWHGRDWEDRRKKLEAGANPAYWLAKIGRNRERDVQNTRTLECMGWTVLRFWETDILSNPSVVAQTAIRVLKELQSSSRPTRRLPAKALDTDPEIT